MTEDAVSIVDLVWETDLDSICIYAFLNRVAARAVANRAGLDFPAEGEDWEDDNFKDLLEEGGAVVDALTNAGMLRREWFEYDETDHSVRAREP